MPTLPVGMEANMKQTAEDDNCNVCVAVKLRPLVPSEVEQGSRESLLVTPGMPQVSTGQHVFTYDHVFGGDCGSDPIKLYSTCVAPMVDGLFRGYNATVFAYGQTGSGKTYTMGSEYRPGGSRIGGVIPEAIDAIFSKIASIKDWQCSVRVSFVEIHKEEVRDLLVTTSGPRAAVSIREVLGGGVCLYGAVEKEVRSQEEMAAVLEMGTLCRATASTSMNNRSSRSHAIFTITLEQRRQVAGPGTPSVGATPTTGRDDDDDDDGDVVPGDGEDAIDDYLCAKMHLVDLAGSERAKRTKAEGARLKEGIHINRGLLALGNVINAIVDQHKHVPYRDSKLTRLLQDSLGGNSRTVMIACVSPADINFEESLNTLRYADRARHIRNKPIINRDPVAAQVAFLRQQIAALRSENMSLKAALAADGKTLSDEVGGPAGGQHWAVVEQLQQENTSLELENTRLKMKVEDLGRELESVKDKCYLLQASLDRVNAEVQLLQGNNPSMGDATQQGADGGTIPNAHDMVIATYVARIAELEKELRAARQFGSMRRRLTSQTSTQLPNINEQPPATPTSAGMHTPGPVGLSQGAASCMSPTPGTADGHAEDGGDGEQEEGPEAAEEEMYYAEMAAHALEQEKMKSELVALQRLLESKERRMAELQVGSGQVPALKQHYDRVLASLQRERDELMSEKVAIMQKMQHLQAASEEERKRLEATYKEKLASMDDKLRSLRHKEREFVSMQKLKQRTEDMCRRLSSDITRIKQQKVALQKTMEASAKQFQIWRQDREKELVQLRKQARRSAAQIQALEALQAKQNAVLQRKICDANAARKKLRELQEMSAKSLQAANSHAVREAGRASADTLAGSDAAVTDVQPNMHAPVLRGEKARREWIEKELDMCNQSYEYRRVLEGELAQRAEANRQLRNITKRLMMVNNLTPASPLVPGPAGLVTPCPAQVGDAVVLQLNERKAALERQLADHNTQIAELQHAWERAKAEEEGRGGGAADAKRFAGLRNLSDAKELLRMVFHTASDLKAMCEDSTIDSKKMSEENELLRVQLDAARKEAEMHRKRAAVHTATAVTLACTTAGGTPFGRSLSMHNSGAGPAAARAAAAETEERDTQEYADLIQDLREHATASKAPKGAGDDTALVGSIDGSVEVSVDRNASAMDTTTDAVSQDAAAAATHVGKLGGVAKQLDTQSFDQEPTVTFGEVTIAGAGVAHQSKGQRGARNQHSAGQQLGRYTGDASQSESDEQEESDEQTSNDDDDDDEVEDASWDPSQATPARGLTHAKSNQQRRSSGRLIQGTSGSGAAGPGIHSAAASGSHKTSGRNRRRRSGSVNASMADAAAVQQQQQWEAAVLMDVNRTRLSRGQPTAEKLTVQLMKECLKDRSMPDGKPWKAGSKTRDQLLADYATILGLSSRNNSHTGHAASDMAQQQQQQQHSGRGSGSGRHQPSSSPSSPLVGREQQYITFTRSKGLPVSPVRSPTLSPQQRTGLSNGNSPSQLSRTQTAGAGLLHNQQLRLSVPQQHDLEPENGVENAGAMTPLSLLYIQKAQEARMRMVDMRQHMGRGSSNTPTAGTQSPMSPSAFAQHSNQAWPAGLPSQPAGHMRHSFTLQHSARQFGGELVQNSVTANDVALARAGASSMPGFSGSSIGAAAFHAVMNSVVAQQQLLPSSSPGSRGSTPTDKQAGNGTQRGAGSRASGSPLSSGRRPGVWR